MLKYERITKENKIAVTYKDRTALFTTDFILALTVAILLHLSFLFLFDIKEIGLLLRLSPSTLIFNVESDLILNQISVEAESGKAHEDIIREPPYEELFLVSMPPFSIEKNFDESLHHFDSKMLYIPYEERFSSLPASVKKKVDVILYHEMAGKEITNQHEIAAFEKIKEKGYAKFNVQVDDQLGKVIWSELKGSSGNRVLEQHAKQLLSTLAFAQKEDSFVSLGEVEIIFND